MNECVCDEAYWTIGLTCVSNNAGIDDYGLGQLLQTRQVLPSLDSSQLCLLNYNISGEENDLIVCWRKQEF
jgi:hypothetical protein